MDATSDYVLNWSTKAHHIEYVYICVYIYNYVLYIYMCVH